MGHATDCAVYYAVRKHFIEHASLPPIITIEQHAKVLEGCRLDLERGDYVARRLLRLLTP